MNLEVVGWNSRHRAALAQVLKSAPRFGPGLREIRFEPDGSLWLTTRELGRVRLGPSDGRLPRRLEVAEHLNRSLPAQIRGRQPQMIDLSDPDQPELSLSGPVATGLGDGRNAPPPRGGQ
jgi:cell division protein FtsQ